MIEYGFRGHGSNLERRMYQSSHSIGRECNIFFLSVSRVAGAKWWTKGEDCHRNTILILLCVPKMFVQTFISSCGWTSYSNWHLGVAIGFWSRLQIQRRLGCSGMRDCWRGPAGGKLCQLHWARLRAREASWCLRRRVESKMSCYATDITWVPVSIHPNSPKFHSLVFSRIL